MKDPHGTRWSYLVGFVLSVALTFTGYWLVNRHVTSGHEWGSHEVLTGAVVALALVQLVVQLRLFLHLGQETGPRWKLLAFGFMALVVGILVFGSLWIMNNLNYHMSPGAADSAIIQDEGIHK